MHVDTDYCDGYAVCEGIRSDIFEVGDDGVAHLLRGDFVEADRQDLEDAVHQCPTQALRLEG